MKENEMRVRFEKWVKELINTEPPGLWRSFKDGVLKARDELCRKKIIRRDSGWRHMVVE